MKKTQSNRKKHRYDLYSEFNQQKHSSLAHRRKIIARIMQITFDGSHHSLKLENSTNLTFDIYPKYKK